MANTQVPSGSSTYPSEAEKNQAIKGFFAQVSEDKFTNVKRASLRYLFKEWKYYRMDGGVAHPSEAMVFQNLVGTSPVVWANAELRMNVDYRHLEDVDGIFFTFFYKGVDYKWPGMEQMALYVILDGEKKYKFDDCSGHEFDSKVDNQALHTTELAQLTIPLPEFIDIAGATRVEYRLSMGSINLEGRLDASEITLLKGFYNNVFDESYEVDRLYEFVDAERKAKAAKDSSGGSNSGGCYIATAVYGDYDHPSVVELRKFRDNFLMTNAIGRVFVKIYYRFSPMIAKRLVNSNNLNSVVRSILERIITGIGRISRKP